MNNNYNNDANKKTNWTRSWFGKEDASSATMNVGYKKKKKAVHYYFTTNQCYEKEETFYKKK